MFCLYVSMAMIINNLNHIRLLKASLCPVIFPCQVCAARLQKTFLEAQEKVEYEWMNGYELI